MSHLDPVIVTDPKPEGARNTWRTYRACLQTGATLSEPFVILQDDCIPVPGFAAAAEQVRARKPDALLAFCLQGMIHSTTRTAFYRALEQGERLLRITPYNWVPAMALGWTPELARRALEWDAQAHLKLRESYNADDARLFYFTRWAEVEVWATVPSVVDHPDDVPAVKNGSAGRGKRAWRTLLLLEGDASEVEW